MGVLGVNHRKTKGPYDLTQSPGDCPHLMFPQLPQQSSLDSSPQSKSKVINSPTKFRIDLHFRMLYCEGIEVLWSQRGSTWQNSGRILIHIVVPCFKVQMAGQFRPPRKSTFQDPRRGCQSFQDYVWNAEFWKSHFGSTTNLKKIVLYKNKQNWAHETIV